MWHAEEDCWTEDYNWFLVDEERIQYAFKNKLAAKKYAEEGFLNYMLLTNLENIQEIMLDPSEFQSWAEKIQTCITIDL